jgi:hypothetical protein
LMGIPSGIGRSTARFAHPARTGQRHHPVLGQQLPQLDPLRVAAHETGKLHRKILRHNHVGCAQRRELVDKVGMAQRPSLRSSRFRRRRRMWFPHPPAQPPPDACRSRLAVSRPGPDNSRW